MIYILNDDAGEEILNIKGDLYKYLVKVRRHTEGDDINFRSRKSMKTMYRYKVLNVEPRSLKLELLSSDEEEVKSQKSLHVAWCIIDSKSIEKVLPSLCEIGVQRISFITCDRSQKNFKLDFKRLERLQEASMQQSGRSTFIEFDTYKNIRDFIKEFPDTKVFDFSDKILDNASDINRVLIGCEGGFSTEEKEFLSNQDVFRLDTPMVLRSESAVVAVASKVLL